MEEKDLEYLIAERTEKVLSELQWHDTLDVQNAVKKAFSIGFRQGLEYIKSSEVIGVKNVGVKTKTKKVIKKGKTKGSIHKTIEATK